MKQKSLKIFLVLLLVASITGLMVYKKATTFTKQRWTATKSTERIILAESFLKDIYYNGMSIDEIENFLGKPDYVPTDNTICYEVGLNYVDSIFLCFDIDKNGKTCKGYIWKTS